MWWLFPNFGGPSLIDIPILIFIFWFFRKLWKESRKESSKPLTPEEQKIWDEDCKQRSELMKAAEEAQKRVEQYVREGREILRELELKELEDTKAKKRRCRDKPKRGHRKRRRKTDSNSS